ncbi:hypothetical protein VSP10_13585 [Myroides odoratimimus]|uniref:hypothetical protein n=1 Tax=Myroides odoratimimus TaxID=76832 RepID=UPI002DBD00E5|nr:hypothetical protein [Myroides odoratimimus]MEC4053817.1 hypothetical protein [Myroides odoratimimus]
MNLEYLFLIISFSASILSALFCLILIVLKVLDHSLDFFTKRLSIALILFYFISIVFYTTVFFYVFNIQLNLWFRFINFQSVLLIPIILYHIIFKLSRLKSNEKFNYIHYVICLLIGIIYLFFNNTNTSSTIESVDLKNTLFFDQGRIIIRIIINSIYLTLAILRLIRFRKKIDNYSTNNRQNSLTWLYNILTIGILLYSGPILFYIIPDSKKSFLFGQLIPNFLFMIFNIILCYNIFSHNFNLIYEDILIDQLKNKINKVSTIDKATFEQYFFKEKPFLNPQLKITDLLPHLMTNRTYLSSFINNTYQMNFSQFINRCRFKEYLELKEASLNDPTINETDLIIASGFKNHESFKKTKNYYYKNN